MGFKHSSKERQVRIVQILDINVAKVVGATSSGGFLVFARCMPTGGSLPIIAAAVPPSSWYQCERRYEEGMGYSRHETTEQYNRSQYSAGSVDNHCQHCLCAVPNRPGCHTIVPVLSFNKRANTRGNNYIVCQKDVPPLTCYNLSIHGSIATIFGKNVAKKVGSQNVLYFPTSPNYCFCTTWETGNPEIASFYLNTA